LKLRVTAPPVDGAANVAVARLLARALGVSPSSISVVKGRQAREKIVEVAGLSATEIRSRLAGTRSV
jgi:uncharacterized protein YggU (UPF0235/DUF167 family)